MRRGSADSIRASGQDPASTGRIQNCNLPSPSCQRRTLRTGRRPYKLHEDAVYPMAFEPPAALHRQLQREAPTRPSGLRGGTAPQAGQIGRLKLSGPKGPLQSACPTGRGCYRRPCSVSATPTDTGETMPRAKSAVTQSELTRYANRMRHLVTAAANEGDEVEPATDSGSMPRRGRRKSFNLLWRLFTV